MQKPLKILQASAGSGKTFSLAAHYLILLFSAENRYREILAVTFTNKATGEMKTRILEVLKGLALNDPSNKIDAYRKLILAAHPNLSPDVLQQKADAVYRKILHDYSRFSVSTIDGFVQKVIRGFAFELGLDSAYALEMNLNKVKEALVDKLDKELDDNPELLRWMIELAMERISDNKSWNYRNELLQLTNEIFQERFQSFEEAILLLSSEELPLLFDNYIQLTRANISAFEEQMESLSAQALQIFENSGVPLNDLAGKSRSPLLKLHKLKNLEFDKTVKAEKLFELANDEETWFQKNKINTALFSDLNPFICQIRDCYTEKYADYVLAKEVNRNIFYLRLMQKMVSLLKDYREESGNLLISDAQKMLNGITRDVDGNPSFIWEKMGNRYKHFLFDEFQDTSENQWNSFRALLANAIAAPSEKLTDHLIVGDAKQSIYRWRNGDWNILHSRAKDDMGPAMVLEESLEENYRSSAQIIDFNNYLYETLPQRLQENLNANIPETLKTWWEQTGYQKIVSNIYGGSRQNKHAGTKAGGMVKIRKIGKPEEEDRIFNDTVFKEYALEKLVDEISDLKARRGYINSDICVLVRSNKEALLVVNALMEAGLQVLSGEALLIANHSAIKLIINTLKALTGLPANSALYKANCMALYARQKGEGVNPQHYFALSETDFPQLRHVLPEDLCMEGKAWLQQPFAELIEKIIKSYGLNTLQANVPYLLAFRDLVSQAGRQGEKGVSSFLEWWEEEGHMKALPSPEKADAIQVVTIHKSKGLAFRAVLLPFCNWAFNGQPGIFWVPAKDTPYRMLQSLPLKFNAALGDSSLSAAYFEELLFNYLDALNILYVATTRCIDYLYISAQEKNRNEFKTAGDALLSIFENEFNEEGLYISGNYCTQDVATEQETGIRLDTYPVSPRLSKIFDVTETRHPRYILHLEQKGRKGSLLHEILAHASGETDMDRFLNQLLTEGTIREEEKPSLKESALAVLNNPELRLLLNSGAESLSEREIITAGGKTLRPDKVLVNGQELIIIDYKFTLNQEDHHRQQVENYKAVFCQMGYQKVSGYLFYAVSNQLVKI